MPAGYSGTPLAKKLGIKPGHTVALVRAPDRFEHTLEGLPDDVQLKRDPRTKGPFDTIILFTTKAPDLDKRWPTLASRLATAGALWVAWPKKTSGVTTDLSGDTVRAFGLDQGLVDTKVCAIDDTWSALRFVRRLKDR